MQALQILMTAANFKQELQNKNIDDTVIWYFTGFFCSKMVVVQ